MGRALVSQLLPALQKMEWAGEPHATPAGALVFKTSVDQADAYRGDPKTLGAALRTARTGDSLPFMYASVAYILLTAAGPTEGSTGGVYDDTGLRAALEWLEMAQEMAPDETDINVIEALIYVHSQRYDDARLILDYLQEQAPGNYYLMRAEMTYWQHVGDYAKAIEWNSRALQEAATVPQRLRLKSSAAMIHQQAGDVPQALQAFTEALHFDDTNAWLCHQISRIHFEQENFEEALRFNEKALSLQSDFPEAQALHERLAEHQRSSGFLGRLFG